MMDSNVRIGGFPYWRKDDGTHVIKCGKWYIEYRPGVEGIYAYSTYVNQENCGHHIPCELREGEPFYPFGIHYTMPVYAKQAIDFMVKTFGREI